MVERDEVHVVALEAVNDHDEACKRNSMPISNFPAQRTQDIGVGGSEGAETDII